MHGILFLKSRTFDFFFPREQVLLVFIRLKITSIDFHKRSQFWEGIKAGTNTRDSGPNSGTKVCKHQNGILNANNNLKIGSDVHYRVFLKMHKRLFMTFDFFC